MNVKDLGDLKVDPNNEFVLVIHRSQLATDEWPIEAVERGLTALVDRIDRAHHKAIEKGRPEDVRLRITPHEGLLVLQAFTLLKQLSGAWLYTRALLSDLEARQRERALAAARNGDGPVLH